MKSSCSFCGQRPKLSDLLLKGEKASICSECAESAFRLFASHDANKKETKFSAFNVLKPREIKAYLDRYVVGEEKAKKTLSVAVYNHYKRLSFARRLRKDEVEIEKSNVLIVGPTGTGKTYLARTLAHCLDVPFCIVDATLLTEAGYVGEDVESVMTRLLQAADYDITRAEWGIVYLDEVDKISRKSDTPSITRDVSGEGVQQALLKLMEGAEVWVPPKGGRKHPEQSMVKINTRNVLFICGGAFTGIENVIRTRVREHALGFESGALGKGHSNATLLSLLRPEDLRIYGLIPELVGRLPVIVHMDALSEETMYRILIEPKNALLKQYKKLFAMDKAELVIQKEALQCIVRTAMGHGLGARGLRGVCERIMLDFMYDMPSNKQKRKWRLTKEYVLHKLNEGTILTANKVLV